ncbi:MAG: hypothetical protein M5U12_18775 [Verrucomicrobia bacterium]|nr:hypothetical protein [Verrucomicrobiota bacterium]
MPLDEQEFLEVEERIAESDAATQRARGVEQLAAPRAVLDRHRAGRMFQGGERFGERAEGFGVRPSA